MPAHHSYDVAHLPSHHAPRRTRLRLPTLQQLPTGSPPPSSPPTSATRRAPPYDTRTSCVGHLTPSLPSSLRRIRGLRVAGGCGVAPTRCILLRPSATCEGTFGQRYSAASTLLLRLPPHVCQCRAPRLHHRRCLQDAIPSPARVGAEMAGRQRGVSSDACAALLCVFRAASMSFFTYPHTYSLTRALVSFPSFCVQYIDHLFFITIYILRGNDSSIRASASFKLRK
jgi:hypothetical protein